MSRAEEIVALQAELLEEFHIPDPRDRQKVRIGVKLGEGGEYVTPLSLMGRAVDLVLYGESAADFDHYAAGPADVKTVAPAIAHGLSIARTYRVQENMTPAIAERADSLPAGTVFGLGDDEIEPPRPAGFAYFEEPVHYYPLPDGEKYAPGVGAISWATIADTLAEDGRPIDLVWLVVVWDDVSRSPWWDSGQDRGEGYRSAVPGARFVPITATAMRPGETLTGTPIPPRKLGDRPIRNPSHVVAALWQMLGETVPSGDRAEQTSEPIDRRAQRRARRGGLEARSEVTTVVLRRERRPVQHPGTGAPHDSRVWVEEYEGWRWIGSGDNRRRVRRKIRGHWSCNNEELPIRRRRVVSELRR